MGNGIVQCSNATEATCWSTLETMQVAPPDDQILNQCKLCYLDLVAQFATDASRALWPPNFLLTNGRWMQVVPSGGQPCNECKRSLLMAKFAINASGAMRLPNSIQVTESIPGSVVHLAMFIHVSLNLENKNVYFIV